jgi:hypothetical protein
MTSLESLNFVRKNNYGSMVIWNPCREGTYEEQCSKGREYASELVSHIQETGNLVIFLHVMRAMASQGDLTSGVETGFLSQISVLLSTSRG